MTLFFTTHTMPTVSKKPARLKLSLLLLMCLLSPLQAAADGLAQSQGNTLNKKDFSEPDFLPVDEAFKLNVEHGPQGTALIWTIAPDYYLYKHKFKVLTADGSVDLTDAMQLSRGLRKTDDYFGQVEVYYHQALANIPASSLTTEQLQTTQNLTVKYQGCAEAGLCYPVQTRTVTLNSPL